jgi:Lrp/AsnC family leucine-responsive transcriptional regulator
MDTTDKVILNLIQENARISNAELSRTLNMAPSGVLERVKKLEASNLIERYETRINHKMLGRGLTVFIQVDTDEPLGSTKIGHQLAEIPEIQEVHDVTGKYTYFVKARVKDSDDHSRLLKKMGELGVRSARTTVVLSTIKETLKIEIE